MHFLAWAIAQKVLFGILLEHFNLPHLNHCPYITAILPAVHLMNHWCSFKCNFRRHIVCWHSFSFSIPYREVSILVDYESVKGGLVIVGGRLGADISLAREHR